MSDIWLGTEDSYRQAISGFQKMEAYQMQHGVKACGPNDGNQTDNEDLKDYLQVVDGVAIISVNGSLVDETLGYMGKYYGMTGYGDIQRAAVAAVKDPEVNSIMLDIKSGGGSVSGVQATAELLTNIDKIKPVTTFSSSYMGSAALWLGMAGREVGASETAIVGSIGTLIVMTSRFRMLQENGIDAVVVRSGKYKALGHPAEPMSDEAIAQAQEKADYLANIFIEYVAQRRGVSKSVADSKFGQGREFIGKQALAVGLVDKVSSYPDAFNRTKSLASNDNRSRIFSATMHTDTTDAYNSVKPKGQTSMHISTPEELAAMAGVDLTADASSDAAAAQASTPEADTTAAAAADVASQLSTVQAELVAAKTEAAATAQALVTAQAELLQAKVLADASAVQLNALAEIVQASVKSMSVALGGTAASTVAIADLAAKHAEVSAEFKSKYRAGGVTSPAAQATTSKPAVAATLNPLFLAAAAIRQSK